MKRLPAVALIVIGTLLAPSLAQAAPGDLDPSFGTGGEVTTDFDADTLDEASSVAIDLQERIVAAGYRSGDYVLARYLGLTGRGHGAYLQ